ncbi:glycosyltransferase [Dysgonomonas capnocytophagoides]|uniref:glycosyltransferase n=1 Tax=Dysgonomonas capnocytophagoides TaxID=45254 RepID=UPI00333FB85A
MNTRLLSVLMSIYKNDDPIFFQEAMDSIWTDQTLKPDQIILIQDGDLPPNLVTIIDNWTEKLGDILILHKNRENMGLTKSLNAGLKYVNTKYIARMDSDDKSDPLRFERQVEYLEQHPEIAILGGSICEINEKGQSINVRTYPLNAQDSRKYIAKASPLAHPAVMMRQAIFESGLRYSEAYRTSQDIALWFDALKAGFKIANTEDVVLYFRITESTFQRRNKNKAVNEFKIYMKGIKTIFGFSPKYLYPISRLAFRMMPTKFIKLIYNNSVLRNRLLQKTNK